MSETTIDATTGAATATRTLANFIGGAWTPSRVSETLIDRDPATGEGLAEVPLSGRRASSATASRRA
jgi:hypothetical protein